MFTRRAQEFEAPGCRDFKDFLRRVGVEVREFPEWPKMEEELRWVANAVKHPAAGGAKKLRERRPELFFLPGSRGEAHPVGGILPAENPLGGDGLYITEEGFKDYSALVRRFWERLAARFDALGLEARGAATQELRKGGSR
jgi:hypothetical protein